MTLRYIQCLRSRRPSLGLGPASRDKQLASRRCVLATLSAAAGQRFWPMWIGMYSVPPCTASAARKEHMSPTFPDAKQESRSSCQGGICDSNIYIYIYLLTICIGLTDPRSTRVRSSAVPRQGFGSSIPHDFWADECWLMALCFFGHGAKPLSRQGQRSSRGVQLYNSMPREREGWL